MDIKTRLTRRPVTTVLWILLVTVMVVFLSIGSALMYASGSLAGIVDGFHTSIAVRTDRGVTGTPIENGMSYEFEKKELYLHQLAFLEGLDSVEGVYFHTLTGGYIPELTPLAGVGYNINETYDNTIVIGTITRMSEPEDREEWMDLSALGVEGVLQDSYVGCEVKIEQIISGHEGVLRVGTPAYDGYCNVGIGGYFTDVTDFAEVGGRYIFYGNYDMSHHFAIDGLDDSGHPWLNTLGVSFLKEDGLHDIKSWSAPANEDDVLVLKDALVEGPNIARLDGSLEEFLVRPENRSWVQLLDCVEKAQHSFPVLGTEALDSMYIFVKNGGSIVAGRSFTQEEYDGGARVCVLNETLAANAGIGIGDTITLSQFLCHNTHPSFQTNSSTDTRDIDGMLNNPTAGEYQRDTTFLTEDETFTVVGLYRLRQEWEDTSYSITPNTIFIPKKAQPEGGFGGLASSVQITRPNLDGTVDTYTALNEGASFGIYMTIKLRNGMVDEFEEAIAASELAGEFRTIDQGFGKIQNILNDISAASVKLMLMVGIGWLVLLALYVLLFQGAQRHDLGIMRSLGTPPAAVRRYLFGGGMAVVAAGMVLGTAITGAVMQTVQNKLFETAFGSEPSVYSNSMLTRAAIDLMVEQSGLPLWGWLLMAVGQLLVFAAVVWLHAWKLSRLSPRKLLSK